MPRDGAIIFSDLTGKRDVLQVACDKCGRKGRYAVARLIEQRGDNARVIDWLSDITAECPKNSSSIRCSRCWPSTNKCGSRRSA